MVFPSVLSFQARVLRILWAATASATLLCVAPAGAQLPKSGIETLLHEATTHNEHEASAAMDAAGNFVVAYTHLDSSSNNGIAVRRFNSQGQPVDIETIPHTNTSAIQQQPAVAIADDGRYVVVWEDNQLRGGNNYDIYFSLYNAAGGLVAGPAKVNSSATGVRENPRVAMNRSTGEFVVVFAGGPSQKTVDIYYRRFNPSGAPLDAADQKVNASTNQLDFAPSVGFSSNGIFVVAWEGNPNSDANFEAYFQRYAFGTASAAALGGNTVASQTDRDTTEVEVAGDDGGNFVLAWVDGLPANQTDPKDLLFRRYDGSAGAVTGVTIFKAGAFSGNGDSLVPRIRTGMEDDEDFVLTYTHNDEIYGQFYSGAGTLKESEIHVNSTSNSNAGEFQSKPWVAISSDGNRAVTTWNGTGAADGNGVYVQQFNEQNPTQVSYWELY